MIQKSSSNPIRRVTRSGAALLASVNPLKSILKLIDYNPDYNMTIIYTYSRNSLAALKVGINSQDRKPFTQTEKDILSIESKDLVTPLPFQSETILTKSGKKLMFNEKIKTWSQDEIQLICFWQKPSISSRPATPLPGKIAQIL